MVLDVFQDKAMVSGGFSRPQTLQQGHGAGGAAGRCRNGHRSRAQEQGKAAWARSARRRRTRIDCGRVLRKQPSNAWCSRFHTPAQPF